MLKLFLNFNGTLLKIRPLGENERFEHSVCWKNRIEFSVTKETMMMLSWTSMLPDQRQKDAEAIVDLVSARYPVSHDYDELARLCPEVIVGQDTDEWVFYGGSFNPWHEGHQACLDLLPKEKYCFVIPDHSPHKDLREDDAIPSLIDLSYKMKFGKNQFLVPTFLLDRKKNPTVDWIERLARNYPDKKLSLLMGFDSLSSLNTWTRAEDLLSKLHTIYVASRLEEENEQKIYTARIEALGPKVVYLGRHAHENVSSTQLRKN